MSNNEKKIGKGPKEGTDIVDKVLRFFRVRPIVGGLEVTDQLLRLAYFDGTSWQFRAIRMEPGVCESCKINDAGAFDAALGALRAQVPELAKKNSAMNVVVSLGAAAIYNQIFSLPLLKGEGFETAVKLNLQMASSADAAETYSGWEIVGRDEAVGKTEVLGAFADRAMVDAMTNALFLAGFVTVAVESKALAIARMMRQYGSGADAQKSYLVVVIDDGGVDFIVVRHGQLYFEYLSPWRDIANEKGEITIERFRDAFTLGLRQVMNFYRQRWQEPIAAIGLSGSSLLDEVRNIIGTVEPAPVFMLEDAFGGAVADAWIVALGSGLRGQVSRSKDHEITFLGEGARKLFEESRVVGFLAFWRVAVPVILGILLAVFVLADIFLGAAENDVAARSASVIAAEGNTKKEMADLLAQATGFNNDVAMIASVQSVSVSRYGIINAVAALAEANSVTLTRVSLQSDSRPILVAGQAQAQDAILSFKTAVERSPNFGSVNLPLSSIQGVGQLYSFSMTFPEKGR